MDDNAYKVGASSKKKGDSVETKKNPAIAFALSFLLPGAGQFYNGQNKKGGIMLGGVIGGFVLVLAGANEVVDDVTGSSEEVGGGGKLVFGLLSMVTCSLWSMIDAPIAANNINKKIEARAFKIGERALMLSAKQMSVRGGVGAKLAIDLL